MVFDLSNRISERTIYFIAGVLLLFLLVNFDPNVTQIFLFFLVFGAGAYRLDPDVTYEFEAYPENRLKNIGIGIISVFGFYVVTGPILNILSSIIGFPLDPGFSTQALFSSNILFSTYILQGSPWISVLMWAVLIPITENLFAIRLWEWLQDSFTTKDTWFTSIVSALIVASIMTAFHINAKGGSFAVTAALITTLLFFFMVLMLTKITGDSIAGNASHITANSLAIRALIPALVISPVAVAVVGILILTLVLKTRAISFILEGV